ncbi:MAG: hypothetical protein GXO07_05995 [Crenarchaeota archaeon]|nr:hypothetical protein [Thermoproteota archaeon]
MIQSLVPYVVTAFVLPGSCVLSGALVLCSLHDLTQIYLLTPEPVLLGNFRNVDKAAYYEGTLVLHERGADYLTVNGTLLPLPDDKLCELKAAGGSLLAVGRDWAVLYNLTSLELVWAVGRVSCPADLSPDGRVVVVYDTNLRGIAFIDITKGVMVDIVKGSFKCVDISEHGYLLVSCSYSIFNGEKVTVGGCSGAAWKAPLFVGCKCDGVLMVYEDKKYCFRLGFTPKEISLIDGNAVVGMNGIYLVLRPYLPNT